MMFKNKNELAPPIVNLITLAIFKIFWQKEKELCIMVLRWIKLLVSAIMVSSARKH